MPCLSFLDAAVRIFLELRCLSCKLAQVFSAVWLRSAGIFPVDVYLSASGIYSEAMERRRKIYWLEVHADWSEEGRDNGVLFQVRDGIKYWCDSEEDPEPDPEHEADRANDRAMELGFMCCHGCHTIKPPEQFHDSVKEKWKGYRYDEVLCLTCTGSPMSKSEVQNFHCYGTLCQGQSRPAYHFIDAMLTERRAKEMLSDLQCARCWVRSLDCEERQRAAECKKRCAACKSQKPIIDFGPAYVKQWLRKISKGDCWRCYECQYPACLAGRQVVENDLSMRYSITQR